MDCLPIDLVDGVTFGYFWVTVIDSIFCVMSYLSYAGIPESFLTAHIIAAASKLHLPSLIVTGAFPLFDGSNVCKGTGVFILNYHFYEASK